MHGWWEYKYLLICLPKGYVCMYVGVMPITMGIKKAMPGTDIEYGCINTHTHTSS